MSPRPGETFTERTPRVVAARKLQRGTQRREAGRFLVEGAQAVTEALADGDVHDLFVTAAAAQAHPELIDRARQRDVRVSVVSPAAAGALSDTVTPQGLIAVCTLVDVAVDVALAGRPQLVPVLVDAGDPGNAGTVIRVADGAGADAVILAGDSVDVHNPKCVRASTGSIFHLPLARHRDLDGLIARLQAAGLQVLATAADGEVDLHAAGGLLGVPTAWLFGSESHGLPAGLAKGADARVRVPLYGRAESLNVASAAAVCVYASARAHRVARTV